MSLEVTELKEGECAALHRTVIFLGNQAVELLLVALQELGGAELAIAVVDIALERAGHLVTHGVPLEGTGRLERLVALFTLVWAHLSMDLHVAPHVVFGREHLVARQALDVPWPLNVHVLHMLVQVGTIVGGVVTLLAVEQLGLVREVRVVVHLERRFIFELLVADIAHEGDGSLAGLQVFVKRHDVTLDVAVTPLAQLAVQLDVVHHLQVILVLVLGVHSELAARAHVQSVGQHMTG